MLKKKGTAIFDDYGNFVEFIEEGGSESPKASPSPSPRPSISDPMERMIKSALKAGMLPSSTGDLLRMLQRNYIDPEGMPVATTEGMEKQGHKFDDKPLHVPFFYRKLASIMRDNMYDREVSGFRSGKLNHKVLYKVMLDNPRVFKRKFERKNKKYNVVVMVDVSGSMADEMAYVDKRVIRRCDIAFDMVEVLVRGFNQNGINYSIQTFNSVPRVTKDIYQRMEFTKLMSNVRDDLDPGGGNDEVRALRQIDKTFKKVRDGKNIALFITDGESGRSRDEIRKEVSSIEKKAKVFAYGMATDSVKSYFKNPSVCNTKEEFMGAVIGDLSRYIRRG